GCYLVPMFIGLVPKSILLGLLRFRAVAIALALGTLTRLAAGVLLVRAGRGIEGAIAASVIGEIVSAGVVLVALRAELGGTPTESLGVRVRDAVLATGALSGFWLL